MKSAGGVQIRPFAAVTATVALATVVSAAVPPVLNAPLAGRQVFPADNWWNLDISGAPVDPRSANLIAWISGRTGSNPSAVRTLHPDFGPPPYGIPYVTVAGDQARVPLTFRSPSLNSLASTNIWLSWLRAMVTLYQFHRASVRLGLIKISVRALRIEFWKLTRKWPIAGKKN